MQGIPLNNLNLRPSRPHMSRQKGIQFDRHHARSMSQQPLSQSPAAGTNLNRQPDPIPAGSLRDSLESFTFNEKVLPERLSQVSP